MAGQLLSAVSDYASIPESYVRPESQRPRLNEVIRGANVPTIDLGSGDEPQIIAQVADACRSFGFFQVRRLVVNHGVPLESMQKMMAVASEFFRLPHEEKAKHYSDDPAKKMRLSTSFNIRKETVRNWRDYLRLHCYPLEEFVPGWPSNPASFRQDFTPSLSPSNAKNFIDYSLCFVHRSSSRSHVSKNLIVAAFSLCLRDVVSTYCREVRRLGFRILRAISLSLELEEGYMAKVLGEQEQHMAVNYYPKCPEPELTYGLQAHTDPNALTILLQDPNVAGLQVLKDGKWIAVNPQPDALVINIGDQLQVPIDAFDEICTYLLYI
ncbi:hypothetical protein BHE74_00026641 [Ensete ventricosum]|nr:hypothetical protein BHE74_00026641 [Ensete ventricosum]